MRSGFKSYALEPLLTGLCINMMHAVASYLCRGIEAVITGLTRNQFVDNTTRGFESLPLRQKGRINGIRLFYSNLVYNKVIYTITNNLLIGLVPSFADYKLVSISPEMHSSEFSITNKKMQNDNHSAFFSTGLFF